MADSSHKSVLFVGNYLSTDDVYTSYTQVLARKLQNRGWHCTLTSHCKPKLQRLFDMLSVIYRLRRSYALAHIDVFSGQAFTWSYLSGWLLSRLNKPYVLSLRGGDLPAYTDKHPRRTRRLLSGAAAVIAPSRYLAEKLFDFNQHIHIIPNGIDIHHYPYKQRQSVSPNIIWLRSFRYYYNPALAVRCVFLLAEGGVTAELTMVGPDKGDGSLGLTQDLAKQLGVINQLKIIKGVPKSQVPHEIEKGDIFINTTQIDNTPVSVIEALACGLCVVSTNVGGIPYLLQDGVDALLVPPDNAKAMAQAIRRLLLEPGLAQKLSTNARHKAEQYDWSIVLDQWDKLFADLIRQ